MDAVRIAKGIQVISLQQRRAINGISKNLILLFIGIAAVVQGAGAGEIVAGTGRCAATMFQTDEAEKRAQEAQILESISHLRITSRSRTASVCRQPGVNVDGFQAQGSYCYCRLLARAEAKFDIRIDAFVHTPFYRVRAIREPCTPHAGFHKLQDAVVNGHAFPELGITG